LSTLGASSRAVGRFRIELVNLSRNARLLVCARDVYPSIFVTA